MKIVLAGGGTAGHVEPALAVAHELRHRIPTCDLLFVGTQQGIENDLVPQAGFRLIHIKKMTFPRQISVGTFIWPLRYLTALIQSLRAVSGADAVIGFGGYVSAPIYIAAFIRRIPIFVHEANAIAGLANRLGSFFAEQTMVAFASTISRHRSMRKAQIVGIPLRASIVSAAKMSRDEQEDVRRRQLDAWGLHNAPTVLIFGGSSGSAHINSVISESLNAILTTGLQVVHVVGRKNELPLSRSGYLPLPYIDDMASALVAANWVISRSGAVTCVELAVLGKYALLIPLPIGNGEQRFNAEALTINHQAEIIDDGIFSREWLTSNLERLMQAASLPRNEILDFPLNSAELIADSIVSVIERAGH